MSRALLAGVLLFVATAGCVPPYRSPPDPEDPSLFTIAPDHAALPPYGGTIWSTPCDAHLGPASAAERSTRLAAMQTWLPGATFILSPLGDRAHEIRIAARGSAPEQSEYAEALGVRLVEITAPLFGAGADIRRVEVAKTKLAWLVDAEVQSPDFTRSRGEHAIAIVVRIDRATGDLRIGLAGELLPIVPACAHEPSVDGERAVRAVIEHLNGPRARPSSLTAADLIVLPGLWALAAADGRSSRGVVHVGIRPDLAVADVDPITYEVLGVEQHQYIIFDPQGIRLVPLVDAKRAFGRTRSSPQAR